MSLSKESPLPSWGYAVAGATGAVLANAAVYPLDMYVITSPVAALPPNKILIKYTNNRVKTKLQVQVKRKPNDKEEPLQSVIPFYPYSGQTHSNRTAITNTVQMKKSTPQPSTRSERSLPNPVSRAYTQA